MSEILKYVPEAAKTPEKRYDLNAVFENLPLPLQLRISDAMVARLSNKIII